MNNHRFDNEFRVTQEQKEQFQRDGFVKLQGFLNAHLVSTLLDRVEMEMNRHSPNNFKADAMFSRANFDFKCEMDDVYELLERPYFRSALTDLVERDLFFVNEICFELERNINKGFPWHVGSYSFGYQLAEEFGCTLWAPLHPVNTKGQGGGLAYVPENVISGYFIYRHIEAALVSTLEAKERAGIRTSASEYNNLRGGVLNAPAMVEILSSHQVEDDFEPGDVLLFNKMVVHRSIMLGEGPLSRRAAYVMRFVDVNSHYDLQRARNFEFPEKQYGKGIFAYKPFTRLHSEIGEAGARDGDVIAECDFFDNRDRRTIRRP